MRDIFATAGIALFSVLLLTALYSMVRPPTLCVLPSAIDIITVVGIAFVGLVVSFLALSKDDD